MLNQDVGNVWPRCWCLKKILMIFMCFWGYNCCWRWWRGHIVEDHTGYWYARALTSDGQVLVTGVKGGWGWGEMEVQSVSGKTWWNPKLRQCPWGEEEDKQRGCLPTGAGKGQGGVESDLQTRVWRVQWRCLEVEQGPANYSLQARLPSQCLFTILKLKMVFT